MSFHNNRKETLLLLLGDMAVFFLSLWLALFLRHGETPSSGLFYIHLEPFLVIFALFVLVFFIAGLYEKHTLILKSKLPIRIFNAQVVNIAIAIGFFYNIPYFGITPKTNLFFYLVISFVLILMWRLYGYRMMGSGKKQKGILIGSGDEMRELLREVNENPRYNLKFISSVDLARIEGVDFQDEIVGRAYAEEVHIIVIDIKDPKIEPILPHLYNLIFSHVHFIDMHKVYEDIFDRVPLSLVKESWFLENISSTSKTIYDTLKRTMDIALSLVLGTLSLALYPLIALGIKLDDGGPVFFTQERVGQNNTLIRIVKFRSMRNLGDERLLEDGSMRVGRVGRFLRRSRLDELPQLWNVLVGDLSMIGPRPETPALAKHYENEVPYYSVRHLVKPGLSGWAQLYHENHPHHKADVGETRVKISFDLYYLKNRSFMLDVKIALKTVASILSRAGE